MNRVIQKALDSRWRFVGVYLLLLAASYFTRWIKYSEPVIPPELSTAFLHAVRDDKFTSENIRLTYRDYPSNKLDARVVVLVHGSPGSERDFRKLAPQLAQNSRVIVPDLPGFGFSTHDIPDYSNRAHARYLLDLLDRLNIKRAHFVGFSMGGGVVLNVADLAPERVMSLTMLSGIGVQELELLGNYYLNHSVHGAQLGAVWSIHNAFPHFGWLDSSMLDRSYARNFYDTDQRPLRSILTRYGVHRCQQISARHSSANIRRCRFA